MKIAAWSAAPTTSDQRRRARSGTGSYRACSRVRGSKCCAGPTPRTPGPIHRTSPGSWLPSAAMSAPGASPGTYPANPNEPNARSSTTCAGLPDSDRVRVSETPSAVLALIGMFDPTVRALREVGYQLPQPFVLDSSAAQRTFGLEPTPWKDILAATIASYRDRATSS